MSEKRNARIDFNVAALFGALDAHELRCTSRQLSGIKRARFWLDRPASDFVYAAS